MQNNKSVLIVEGNELNMKLFRDLLQTYGYQTIEARDGETAIKKAFLYQPDLILLNIKLPKFSGSEVVKQMKSHHELRQVPIIALSSFIKKEEEENLRSQGCQTYIRKPVKIDKFMRVLTHLVPAPHEPKIYH